MIENLHCGPFDGGCLAFAQALEQIYGGEVFVIEGRVKWASEVSHGPVEAQHAVLSLPNGQFLDADGWASGAAQLIKRFNKKECDPFGLREGNLRPYRAGDLTKAPTSEETVKALAELLRQEHPTHNPLTATSDCKSRKRKTSP